MATDNLIERKVKGVCSSERILQLICCVKFYYLSGPSAPWLMLRVLLSLFI